MAFGTSVTNSFSVTATTVSVNCSEEGGESVVAVVDDGSGGEEASPSIVGDVASIASLLSATGDVSTYSDGLGAVGADRGEGSSMLSISSADEM